MGRTFSATNVPAIYKVHNSASYLEEFQKSTIIVSGLLLVLPANSLAPILEQFGSETAQASSFKGGGSFCCSTHTSSWGRWKWEIFFLFFSCIPLNIGVAQRMYPFRTAPTVGGTHFVDLVFCFRSVSDSKRVPSISHPADCIIQNQRGLPGRHERGVGNESK